jgi:hypothetical protein
MGAVRIVRTYNENFCPAVPIVIHNKIYKSLLSVYVFPEGAGPAWSRIISLDGAGVASECMNF